VYFKILGFRFTLKEISNSFAAVVRPKLAQLEPLERIPRETAAVAVILKTDSRARDAFLLIRRADRTQDPWSGQVAFPGGRVEPYDRSLAETAMRETMEEVAVDLAARAEFLGYMGPFEPENRRVRVVPVVFAILGAVRVLSSPEVSSHRWIPIKDLLSGLKRADHEVGSGGDHRTVPSFRFGDYLVWGLTERILSSLVETAECT
jgi:8-oxo-dGTP pyrophosphatase MutT (NUDIX family)